jgi:hypothetical protein
MECFWNNIFIIFIRKKFCKGNVKVVRLHVMKAYGGVLVQLLILNRGTGCT